MFCCFFKEEHGKVLSHLIPTITKWCGMLYSETEASVTVFNAKCVIRQMPQLATCLTMSNVSHDTCRRMQSFKCHHLDIPLWTFRLRSEDCPQGAQRAPELSDDLNLALNHFMILSYRSCTIWKLKYVFPPKEIKAVQDILLPKNKVVSSPISHMKANLAVSIYLYTRWGKTTSTASPDYQRRFEMCQVSPWQHFAAWSIIQEGLPHHSHRKRFLLHLLIRKQKAQNATWNENLHWKSW